MAKQLKKVLKIELDVTKIDKAKIVDKSYTNKDGQEVTKKVLQVDALFFEPETAHQTDTYNLLKHGFCTHSTTKEERDSGYKSEILGDIIEFQNKNDNPATNFQQTNGETIEIDEIPF
jgi:hypothetical protein